MRFLGSSWSCWNHCLPLVPALGKPPLFLSVLPVLDPEIFRTETVLLFLYTVVKVSVYCVKKNYYNKYRRAWVFICWYFHWSAKTSKWAVFWIVIGAESILYQSFMAKMLFFLHKACCTFPVMYIVICFFPFTVL